MRRLLQLMISLTMLCSLSTGAVPSDVSTPGTFGQNANISAIVASFLPVRDRGDVAAVSRGWAQGVGFGFEKLKAWKGGGGLLIAVLGDSEDIDKRGYYYQIMKKGVAEPISFDEMKYIMLSFDAFPDPSIIADIREKFQRYLKSRQSSCLYKVREMNPDLRFSALGEDLAPLEMLVSERTISQLMSCLSSEGAALKLTAVDTNKILSIILDRLQSSVNESGIEPLLTSLRHLYNLRNRVRSKIEELQLVDSFKAISRSVHSTIQAENSKPNQDVYAGFVLATAGKVFSQHNQEVAKMRSRMGDVSLLKQIEQLYNQYAVKLIRIGMGQQGLSLDELRRLSLYAKRFEEHKANIELWNRYISHRDIPVLEWFAYRGVMNLWETYHPYTTTLPWVANKVRGGVKRMLGVK